MKGFKPRASQLTQQRYAMVTTLDRISEELLSSFDWKVAGRVNIVFTASEVEVYAVLSVAQPGDATWLLSKGIRSAEDAMEYFRSRGAEQKTVRRAFVADDALRRGIPSQHFMSRMNLAIIAHPDDDTEDRSRVMDVLELSAISSLEEQWGWVASEVKRGAIRLEDIKYLGVSKLKSFRRLVSVKDALQVVHEPGAAFSLEDLKYLVDRAARDSLKTPQFNAAVEYLVAEGVEGLKKIDSLKLLRLISVKHYDDARLQRVSYEIDFRAVYERKAGASFPEKELVELFDAGVPAVRAAELMNEGLPVGNVIGVAVGGIEKPLADGWL